MTHGRGSKRLGFPNVAWFVLLALAAAPAVAAAQAGARSGQLPVFERALTPDPPVPRERLAEGELTGVEKVLFGIGRGVGLLIGPLLEKGAEKGLISGGGGVSEGLKIEPGSLGSKSGGGMTVGYVLYPAPVWAGASVGFSTKAYQEHSAFIGVRDPRGTNYLRATGTYDLDREDEFSGLGMQSSEDDESDYRQEEIRFLGDGQVTLGEVFVIGARGGYHKNNLLAGKNDDIDNTELVFGDVLVGGLPIPGLPHETYKFSQFGGFLALDTRDVPGNPAGGVRLGGSFDAFRGIDETPFDWDRWSGEFEGYLQVPDETRVVAVRAWVVHQEPQEDQTLVPFFQLISLGGSSVLRSFPGMRFQDNDVIYGAFEFRHRVWVAKDGQVALDGGLFAETGGVYQDITEEAELGDMEQSFGTELRLLVPDNVLARFGVAVGSSEGAKVYLGGGGRF